MSKRHAYAALAAFTLIVGGCDEAPMDPDAGPTLDGADACEGRDLCATAGSSCTGDSLVTCAADADGCLVETTTDCGASGRTCDDSGSAAMCIDDDPCASIPAAERCDTAGRTCDGDSLEVCAENADGCLVLDVTDCAASDGGACDDSGAMAMCVLPTDPCDGVADACATEGTSCSGDDLVECAPNAFGCLVETETDCSARAGGSCDGSASPAACTFTGDPCDGIEQCAAEGAACEGPELVECAADAYGCLVETRTDCADTMFGFCDGDATPAPVCSTAATDPCMGVTECSGEGRSCSGDDLVVCAANAFGCLVEDTTDCTASSEVCGESGGVAMCDDVCAFRATCPQATYCAGAEAVSCSADADGCLVEDSRTTCDGGCTGGACVGTCAGAAPTVLDCTSGTVSGDVAMGTDTIDANDCSSLGYAAEEQVFVFQNADRADVEIVANRLASSADYDLYVLDGGDGTAACDSGLSCLADSTNGSTEPTETVDFVAEAGDTYYLVYDRFESSSDTSTPAFELTVDCTPIVCGDSTIAGDETCDDGNAAAGDGCSDTCEVESGYVCTGTGPGSCTVASNDVCAGATVVTSTTTISEDTADGGARPTDASCSTEGSETGETLYYSVTVPVGQVLEIELTYGTATDLLFFTQTACSATTCSGVLDLIPPRQEILSIPNTTGSSDLTTIVGVGPWNTGDGGTFHIAFTYRTPAAASNDACAGATAVSADTTITGEDTYRGGARPSDPNCSTGGAETGDTLYYAVTVPDGQQVDVALDYVSAADLLMFEQTGCAASGCAQIVDALTYGEETLQLVNTSGSPVTRIVGVGPYAYGAGGTYDISFAFTAVPMGETCSVPQPITASGTFSDTTADYGDQYNVDSSCTGFSTPGPDVVYEVALAAGETLDATLTPAGDFDAALYVLTDCSALTCVDGADATGDGVPEAVSYTATSAATVYLIVDSYSSSVSGSYSLDVTLTP